MHIAGKAVGSLKILPYPEKYPATEIIACRIFL
jgi:hypothetical protein